MVNFSENFINVNEQIKLTLFTNKKVQFQQEIFSCFYFDIFPCPKLFVEFLSANNREQQMICAKRIINRIHFLKFTSAFSGLFKNLIDMEESEILDNDDSYKPRDHSIHSVYTYLLGIYLYFSLEIFNNQLRIYFSKTEFENLYSEKQNDINIFLSFLDSWKLFSLCHDIGYPVEYLVNIDRKYKSSTGYKIVKNLDSITDYVSSEFSIYNILFFLGINIIINQSKITLSDRVRSLKKSNIDFYTEINNTFKTNEYVKLDNIHSEKTMRLYLNAFEKDELLCFIIEKNAPVSFYCSKTDKSDCEYCFGDLDDILDSYSVNHCLEFYYPIDALSKILEKTMKKYPQYVNDIKESTNYILERYSIDYAGIANHNRYMDFLYEIYNYVKVRVNDYSVTSSMADLEYYKKKWIKLSELTLDDLGSYLYKNIDNDLSKSVKDSLSEKLKISLENYVKSGNFQAVLNEFFSKSKSENYDLIFLYDFMFNSYKKEIVSNKNLFWNINTRGFQNVNKTDKKFIFELNEFFSNFASFALDSNLIWDKSDVEIMQGYSTPYYAYDHGVCSAYISMEVFCKSSLLLEVLLKNCFADSLTIPKRVFSGSCYAIFIHNMYVDFFKTLQKDKTNVKHDILKNPFVYFALFCDNMQVWDRVFNINHGKVDLSIPSISNKEMSINVFDNRIYLGFKTTGFENIIYNYRQGLDDYLKDGSKLIVLDISEE